MDEVDPPTLTPALAERHSRRHALKLLAGATAGGVLALGARSVPETLALTARPALFTGFTHLAGTTNGLLLYRAGDGFAESGTVSDGLFLHQDFPGPFVSNWTHITGATRSLFFYRKGDGLVATGYLDANGVFVQPAGANYHIGTDVTRVPGGTRSGRFLLYGLRLLSPSLLTTSGYYRNDGGLFNAGGAWTHGAGAGINMFVLYRADTGAAATGRIGLDSNSALIWIPRTTYQFSADWTHIVGSYAGGVLFYNRLTGKGAIGYLTTSANFVETGNPVFGAGWTHVVGAGSRGVLFYHRPTGRAIGGLLTGGGSWVKTTTYGY